MSFKAKLKQVANIKGITPQQLQQNYLIEVFLSKLAKSKYKHQFIIKGGYLIGGISGVDMRTTMDLDTTIKGFTLTEEQLLKIANDIVEIETEESFALSVESVEEIREMDDYPGLKLKLRATFEKIKEHITIDVTTGDVITPSEIDFKFRKIFEDSTIELLTYPLETILAEKIETILSRGIGTTRPRDFYDVYLLVQLKRDQIDFSVLKRALINTTQKRQSEAQMLNYELILQELRENEFQKELWRKYQRQYNYVKDTTLEDAIDVLMMVMQGLENI